jgi:magnesium transporter
VKFAEFELTKEFRDRFQQAVDEYDALFIQESLRDVNSADVTSLLYEFNGEEFKYVLDLLSLDAQSKIIKDLDPDTRKKFLTENYSVAQITSIINYLDSDDAADILNELPIKTSEEIHCAVRCCSEIASH